MKQGARTSEETAVASVTAGDHRALRVLDIESLGREGGGTEKNLSFVICMQIQLLHKLTFDPGVSPHLVKSCGAAGRVTDELILYCG